MAQTRRAVASDLMIRGLVQLGSPHLGHTVSYRRLASFTWCERGNEKTPPGAETGGG
jgi:hypothetical protein